MKFSLQPSPLCLGRELAPLHMYFKAMLLLFFLVSPLCSSRYHQGISLASLGKKWKQFAFHRVNQRHRGTKSEAFPSFGYRVWSGELGGRTGECLDVLTDSRCICDCSGLRVISRASRRAKITPRSPKHNLSDPHTNLQTHKLCRGDKLREQGPPCSIQIH